MSLSSSRHGGDDVRNEFGAKLSSQTVSCAALNDGVDGAWIVSSLREGPSRPHTKSRMGAPLAELEGRRKPSFDVPSSECRGKPKTPNDKSVLCEKGNLKDGVSCKRYRFTGRRRRISTSTSHTCAASISAKPGPCVGARGGPTSSIVILTREQDRGTRQNYYGVESGCYARYVTSHRDAPTRE